MSRPRDASREIKLAARDFSCGGKVALQPRASTAPTTLGLSSCSQHRQGDLILGKTTTRTSRGLHAPTTGLISKSAAPLLSVNSTDYNYMWSERGRRFAIILDTVIMRSAPRGSWLVAQQSLCPPHSPRRVAGGVRVIIVNTNVDREEGSRSNE